MACHASTTGSCNLLLQGESYADFLQQTMLPARKLLQKQGLKKFHELRTDYACERYKQLTGHFAPVNVAPCYRMDRTLVDGFDNGSALSSDITGSMWFRLT